MFEQLHCPLSYAVYKFHPETGGFTACCDAKLINFNESIFNQLGKDYFERHPRLIKRKSDLYNNIKNGDCDACWDKESEGLTSMRMFHGPEEKTLWNNRELSIYEAKPSRFELWMNSTCNLGCMMCHLGNSNTLRKIWYTDLDTYGNDGRGFENWLRDSTFSQKQYKNQFNEYMLDFILKYINICPNNELSIAYLGGEPTLHSEMYDHADLFIEASREGIKNGKKYRIEITTNGTSKDKLNERFYAMFEKYKRAGWTTAIMVSQDGAEQYAQVRYGAEFEQIKKNFNNWLRPEFNIDRLITFSVISAINLPYFDVMAEYIDESIRANYNPAQDLSVSFNTMTQPQWMRVKYLPRKYAEESIKRSYTRLKKLHEEYPYIAVKHDLFKNISDTLPDQLSQEDAEYFFEKVKYVNSVYQKYDKNWNMYKIFDFIPKMAEEYNIEL